MAGATGSTDDMRKLKEELEAMRGQLAALTATVAVLTDDQPAGGVVPPTFPSDHRSTMGAVLASDDGLPGNARISRRGALALGAAAAVGLGALADSGLAVTPAAATTGAMQYGASNDAGADETDLISTSDTETLSVTNNGSGAAIAGTVVGNGTVLQATNSDTSSTGTVLDASTAGIGGILKGQMTNGNNPQPGIYLDHSGTGVGVHAVQGNNESTNPAFFGETTGTGAALSGAAYGGAPGVLGASTFGYGASLNGGLAPILLSPASTAGAPTSGTHVLGELYVDSNGVQYRCAAAGTPGTWVPQYSVVPLPSPVRVINTSTGEGGISGPLVPGATVHTSSALAGTNGIPVGAIGVVANLALSGVGGAVLNGFGVLTIFPAGTATPATANINAGAGCYALSNTVTVAFGTGADAGQLSLVWDGGGAVPNAQAYLDVTAYLL
jgi:hypothetical protein